MINFEDLTREEMLEATGSRNKDYDGVFYTAVKTTGIVCLPSCPARALPKNKVFYKTLQEALNDGYRPCKRCKPEQFNK